MERKLITLSRIINGGAINFVRNISLAVAAIAVMVVTLSIVLFSIITNATFENTISQITNKIDVSVFLKDSDTKDQTQGLIKQLRKLPNVKSVRYLDKTQALKEYEEQNAGNKKLLAAVDKTSNPLPATIVVKPIDLNKIQDIKDFLSKPDAVKLQSEPPSYSGNLKEAIDNITHATNVLRKIGIVTVVIFAVVSALIIFNTIQMAIFNRRDEITIMRLLGASTSYIRGPFVVESAIYGVLSAIFSVLIVNSVFLASNGALQASSLGLLDINYANRYFHAHFWALLLMQIAIGIIIGTASSIIATRRYLKFKTS